jgi:four helix bundle protein
VAGEVRSYEDLRIWQDGMLLAEMVYRLCRQMPKDEIYGLASQLKRAAVSVPSNIAEGSERSGTKELVQFLYIAKGSLAEVETQLKLAARLQLISEINDALTIADRVSRGISNLIKSLKKD